MRLGLGLILESAQFRSRFLKRVLVRVSTPARHENDTTGQCNHAVTMALVSRPPSADSGFCGYSGNGELLGIATEGGLASRAATHVPTRPTHSVAGVWRMLGSRGV